MLASHPKGGSGQRPLLRSSGKCFAQRFISTNMPRLRRYLAVAGSSVEVGPGRYHFGRIDWGIRALRRAASHQGRPFSSFLPLRESEAQPRSRLGACGFVTPGWSEYLRTNRGLEGEIPSGFFVVSLWKYDFLAVGSGMASARKDSPAGCVWNSSFPTPAALRPPAPGWPACVGPTWGQRVNETQPRTRLRPLTRRHNCLVRKFVRSRWCQDIFQARAVIVFVEFKTCNPRCQPDRLMRDAMPRKMTLRHR